MQKVQKWLVRVLKFGFLCTGFDNSMRARWLQSLLSPSTHTSSMPKGSWMNAKKGKPNIAPAAKDIYSKKIYKIATKSKTLVFYILYGKVYISIIWKPLFYVSVRCGLVFSSQQICNVWLANVWAECFQRMSREAKPWWHVFLKSFTCSISVLPTWTKYKIENCGVVSISDIPGYR